MVLNEALPAMYSLPFGAWACSLDICLDALESKASITGHESEKRTLSTPIKFAGMPFWLEFVGNAVGRQHFILKKLNSTGPKFVKVWILCTDLEALSSGEDLGRKNL